MSIYIYDCLTLHPRSNDEKKEEKEEPKNESKCLFKKEDK